MAEVFGTVAGAVSLAGLFKVCVQAFDIIQTARNQPIDLKKLNLRLSIEKCRLYTWGQAMGLTSASQSAPGSLLDQCPHQELVRETLSIVLGLFKDSKELSSVYGCTRVEREKESELVNLQTPTSAFRPLSVSFENFDIKQFHDTKSVSVTQRSRWVIRDRKKFEGLISEAKNLIDGLQAITEGLRSQEFQKEVMASRICKITNVRTLDWVSEVCVNDYPDLSNRASLQAETVSEVNTLDQDIQNWGTTSSPTEQQDVGSGVLNTKTVTTHLEDMTTTEIKQSLMALLVRHNQDSLQAGNRAPNDVYAEIILDITEARIDKEFREEETAILEWFRVLSDAERVSTFCAFMRIIHEKNGNPAWSRFCAWVQLDVLLTLCPREVHDEITLDYLDSGDGIMRRSLKLLDLPIFSTRNFMEPLFGNLHKDSPISTEMMKNIIEEFPKVSGLPEQKMSKRLGFIG